MSLFSKICEGIINEVDAKQAYERFYNSIPIDQYNAIIGGDTNIDKFVQFILNAVRDDEYPAKKAAEIVKAFKESDALVRQNIANNFKAGEYDTPDEILIDLEYLKNGGVVNKNKFAKEGLIVLAKDDNWTITCTTNYLANTHYFGYTSWCTASDRAGRYDGYEMFRRYTNSGKHILIQATSNADKNKTYQMEIAKPHEKFSSFDYPDDGGFFAQVCDKDDNAMYGEKVVTEIVGEILRNVLDDTEKMGFCLKKEQEQWTPEEVYQEKQNKIINIKKEKLKKEIAKKYEKLKEKVDEKNETVDTNTDRYWEEVVAKKLYENPEFLRKVYHALEDINDCEDKQKQLEIAKSVNFVVATHKVVLNTLDDGGEICKFVLQLLNGPKWRVVEFWGDYGLRDYRMEFSLSYISNVKMCVIAILNDDEVIKVLTHTEDGFDCSSTSFYSIDGSLGGSDVSARYLAILNFNGFDCIFDTKTCKIYKYLEHDGDSARRDTPRRVVNMGDELFFFSKTNFSNIPFCSVLINSSNEVTVLRESPRFLISNAGTVLLDKETGAFQVIYGYDKTFRFNLPKEVVEQTIECFKSDLTEYIYFRFEDGKENVLYFGGEKPEFVFGENHRDVDVYDVQGLVIAYTKKFGKRVEIVYSCEKGVYELKDENSDISFGECDKYGVTKKEKIGDYNMKKYWKGYSPEQQAQMDAMWADRKHSVESNGAEAMKAWDDYGTKRYPQDSYHIGRGNAARLGHSDDYGKDHWEGRVGLKDPENWWSAPGSRRTVSNADFGRDFYKVGTNGKPLEQPWRDEDEVPAKFAEYPEEELSEAVNKIKSLFGRMGLLEG